GTRGSAMALFQAGLVRDRLREAHAELAAEHGIEIVPIRTTGDRVQTRLLAEIGGKGLFTKEIEEALLDRRIDLAVHSLKDMETRLPAGLEIGCILPRDDPRDVLVSRGGIPLAQLPRGARVGTASLRRTAQLLRARPDLAIAPIRGLATIANGRLTLNGLLLSDDGTAERRGRGEGAVGEAVEIGTELGLRLRRGASPEFGLG